jgi:N-acyl amino acid synthase of PEP-CTERM/exosortase system
MPNSLADHFAKYFRFRIANTDQLKRCCFRLRHQVYAEELGWETVRSDGLEMDQVDPSSVHCFLQHIPSGVIAGTVRLVIKRPYDALELPVEVHCGDRFLATATKPSDYAPNPVTEVSRLAVPSYFRRRSHEDQRSLIYESDSCERAPLPVEESRQFPNIALGLYLGAFIVSRRLNIRFAFALMEPRLNRRLQQLGFKFQQQSELLEYRGARAVYSLCVDRIASELIPEVRDLHSVIADQFMNPSERAVTADPLNKPIAA